MDLSEPSSSARNTTSINSFEELARDYQSLKRLFKIVLTLLIVLSGSICVFLLREVVITRKKVKAYNQYIASYQTMREPVIQNFRRQLTEFSKTNADFRPILEKYFGPGSSLSNPNPTANSAASQIPSLTNMLQQVPSLPAK